MRVCLVVLEDFPGSENRVQRQAAALSEAGHDVRIYAASGRSTQSTWRGVQIERSPLRREKVSSTGARLREYGLFPLHVLRWVSRCRSWPTDVVQVANPPDWLALAAHYGDRRAKSVLDIHDVMPELAIAQDRSRTTVRALEFLEGLSVRTANLVITTSPYMRDALASRHGVHAEIVLNGVDESVFTRREPEFRALRSAHVKLVYHGTLSERFGLGTLLRALATLNGHGTEASLDIYGDGDARSSLEQMTDSLGLRGAVTFHGQVPSEELPRDLPQYDIGVIPYEDSPFIRTAYSMKAFEYAALGIPVVASDLRTIRDQLRG
ncbi:MAG: glycosyltransferase family 4 protein [Actinomycetota bacterium]|nr:glycosyltransferase family 4 protein [Actinomycetota bacterium]